VKQSSIRVGVAFSAAMSLSCAAQLGQEQGQVTIEGRLVLDPETDCVAVPQIGDTGAFLSGGVYDVGQAGARGYTAAIQVTSNLGTTQPVGDIAQDRTRSPNYVDYGSGSDSSIVALTRGLVQVKFNATPAQVNDFNSPLFPAFSCASDGTCQTTSKDNAFSIGGIVGPIGGSVANTSAVFMPWLGVDETLALAQGVKRGEFLSIDLEIRVEGQTQVLSGPLVSSPLFASIQVCNGCLAAPVCPTGEVPASNETCGGPGVDEPLIVCKKEEGA
jgi:hypothetical protein